MHNARKKLLTLKYSEMNNITLITMIGIIMILNSLRVFADTTYVAGTIVNETWSITGSPYCATEDLFISGLTIEPGVEVLFLGDFVFEVGGVLTSIGTEQDSIKFNKVDSIDGWQGVYFNYSSPGSEVAYSRIEGSRNSGIRIINSEPILRNSTITNNSVENGDGGGIYTNSPILIEDCTISNNSIIGTEVYLHGAGIFTNNELTLASCIIKNNSMNRIGSNVGNEGGGVYGNGTLIINKCNILNNLLFAQGSNWSNYSHGAGIWFGNGYLEINNSVIENNSAAATSTAGGTTTKAKGGGLFVSNENQCNYIINNSIISHNLLSNAYSMAGGGIHSSSTDSSKIVNSTIAYNSHDGIYHSEGGPNEVINSIVWGNSTSQIFGTSNVTYSDVQDGYTGEGNINLNPIFSSDTNLHIVPGSPCIDTGNPDPIYYDECFPPSQETELNDMGVDGGPLGCNWIITEVIENTIEIEQVKIYPNPFTTETTIEFSNPSRNNFELSILSVSGKQVFTSENINSDKIVIKRNGLSKGVYFLKLTSEKTMICKKLIIR